MRAKDVRNLIATLIILAIGVKLLITLGSRYISQAGAAGFDSLVSGFTGLGDLTIFVLAIFVVLLIPYYLSKRSQERVK